MSLKERLSLGQEPLYVMDGSAFIFRAFFTARSMQRSDGFPTNVLVGMARLLLKILREEQPKYFLFVRDGHGKNFRHELYPQYKANREATPEDLVRQLEPVSRLVSALGIRQEETQGFEADDCMASLAARFSSSVPVVLISGDKDIKQCLGPEVYLWNLAAKEEKIVTAADLFSEYGVAPERWPDMQALIGDTADNIPGVPGIGPKTAKTIFSFCSSLEDIRDHPEKLPPKLSQKLMPHREDMFLWRRLTKLSTDYPLRVTLDDLSVGAMQAEQLRSLAKEFELVQVRREMEFLLSKQGEGLRRDSALSLPGEQRDEKSCVEPCAKVQFRTVGRVSDLPPSQGLRVAYIVDPSRDVRHLALGARDADGAQELSEELTTNFVWVGGSETLADWLGKAGELVVADLKSLLRTDPPVRELLCRVSVFDLGLACYLLRPEDTDFGWSHLEAHWALPLQDGSKGPAQLALALHKCLQERLATSGLLSLYRELELPLVPVLGRMEEVGIALDLTAFRAFLSDVQGDLDRLTEKIYALTGQHFNIRSSQQLADILFTTLHLTVPGKTKGGQLSTSQSILEKLAGAHPVIAPLLQYRKLEKVRSTYLDPLPRRVDKNGRVHTTFDQKGTATGRLSSRDPNLQNIPARGELGRRMRTCFVAAEGCVLISSDYSQIELRMLAHISQDAVLLEAFRKGVDIHAHTAALIYDVAVDEVTADMRRSAKTINFGLIYGMGALKLSQELKVSLNKAKEFIEHYFARLTGLKRFYEEVVEKARHTGYVTTIGGRRRTLPDLVSANTQLAAQAGRQAINTVIQGSAADVIKLAMLSVDRDPRFKEIGARLILQVHDELIVEVPEAFGEEAGALVARRMEEVRPCGQTLLVPLVADWGLGKNWGEAH